MTDSLILFATTLAQQGPVVPGTPGAGNGGAAPLGPGAEAPAGGGGGAGGSSFFFIVIAMMVVFMLVMSMSGRRQRKEREKLLSGLKRNDRVQTVGGVIGTVIELTDKEMVLRVDEASNTRIRFARSSVQQILREGKDSGKIDAGIQPTT